MPETLDLFVREAFVHHVAKLTLKMHLLAALLITSVNHGAWKGSKVKRSATKTL